MLLITIQMYTRIQTQQLKLQLQVYIPQESNGIKEQTVIHRLNFGERDESLGESRIQGTLLVFLPLRSECVEGGDQEGE